jgi:NAD(P)-dependent dehydrogenase (short-subunit alcohol dehydrogenase family)
MNIAKSPRKIALVTGGANGIGYAIAERLAVREDCAVCIADLDGDGAAAAAQRIRTAKGEASAFTVDLADEVAIHALCDRIEHEVGKVDILVNNAAVSGVFRFEDVPAAHLHKVWAVNVTAAFLLAQRMVPAMRSKGWGRIVNVSSINGFRAGSGRSAYGTTKAAIIGLTRQIAIDTAESGITSNAVAPGVIATALMRTMVPEGSDTEAMLMRSVPMNRFGTPENVAAVVAFLTSREADYVTGCTIPVDGGFTAAGIFVRGMFAGQDPAEE